MAAYRIVSLFLAVALSFPPPGAATASIHDGFAAYERGDYHTAFREFMALAPAGDPLAQAMIALMYHHGTGVPQDHAEAARWYRRSAEQGDPLSQFQLGVLFHNGLGLPQDFNQAIQWFQRAATQGSAAAQYSLGAMYATGKGVPPDDSKAVRWFGLAAEQGVAEAQFDLGVAYANGWGGPQDRVLAYMWFNLAAARSSPGEEVRERAVEERDYIAARLTPAERARGQELARNWRPRVAAREESGSPAYAVPEMSEPPRTQRQAEPNPFRAALELQARQNREVQQLLADLGYDPGPVDGVLGPRTRSAISAFQADLGLPGDGQIFDELIAALRDAAASGQPPHGTKPWERYRAGAAPTQRQLDSTGTGFAISEDGHIVTNHHVVNECAEVRVRAVGQEVLTGAVVARDAGNDLALLRTPARLPAAVLRNDSGIRPGDSVVAVGFPLPGLLASEANVTTGTVSALAGVGNDTRFLQMTVPVQPGNSGGPLLDLQGRVVGVVVGKLDALKVASLTGDIPQNVNFAIKAGVVRTFLDASGVGPSIVVLGRGDPSSDESYPITRDAATVGAEAKAFIVLVECWK